MTSTPGYPPAPNSPQVIYQQVVRTPSNGLAVAALVLGIVAIVLGIWIPIPIVGLVFAFLSFVPAVLGVVFGVLGLRRSAEITLGRGAAITGLTLGAVTLAIGVLTTLVWLVLMIGSAAGHSST